MGRVVPVRHDAGMTATRLALLVLVAGVAVRVTLLLASDVWYDEAANGLMSLAVLRGELPVYLYDQAFWGVLDDYMAAPFHDLDRGRRSSPPPSSRCPRISCSSGSSRRERSITCVSRWGRSRCSSRSAPSAATRAGTSGAPSCWG
jgi:hypothetical protein